MNPTELPAIVNNLRHHVRVMQILRVFGPLFKWRIAYHQTQADKWAKLFWSRMKLVVDNCKPNQ